MIFLGAGASEPFGIPTSNKLTQVLEQILIKYDRKKILDNIKTNRKLSDEEIGQVATGSLFLGKDAVQLGLADEIGNILTSIETAASMTGLWNFIIVTPDMDDRERLLRALL